MDKKEDILIIRIKPKDKRLLRWLASKNRRTMTGHVLALINQDAKSYQEPDQVETDQVQTA